MYSITIFIICSLIIEAYCIRLPSWFKLGAATSAPQTEGGWNASDRSESYLDNYLHKHPELANTDIACDSYRLWRRDLEMASELGLDMYRFSISWSRLLPTGFSNYISEDGKRYYNNLIDGLLEKGIEPCVTLFHNDMPQIIQDYGGWANPLIADWFADYARIVFSLYGDRVKTWLTINEPFIICDFGYTNTFVPYVNDTTYLYQCNKHILLAHAKAYRVYEKEFKPDYNGKLSIVSLFPWMEPAAPEEEDDKELTVEYLILRYFHPIYSNEGGWPKKIEDFLISKSQKEGEPTERLPPFTLEEIKLVKGTYDFFALNHYTSRMVRKVRPGERYAENMRSLVVGTVTESKSSWGKSDTPWFAIYPEGLRKLLNWLKKTYDINEIMISENGYRSLNGSLYDTRSIDYTKSYLEQALLAVEDGVNVTGYLKWSLMDTFEGDYSVKFGLYSVDFDDVNRTRTMRAVGHYYSRLCKTRCTDPDECE